MDNPKSLYQASLDTILSTHAETWKFRPQFLSVEEGDVPFLDLHYKLIFGEENFASVVDLFLKREQEHPPWNQAVATQLQQLLPVVLPQLMLVDLWRCLLVREYELSFLHFWQHTDWLFCNLQFEEAELSRFRGSQLLYPYVVNKWRQHCFEEACYEMRSRFNWGYFGSYCADCGTYHDLYCSSSPSQSDSDSDWDDRVFV